MTRTISVIFLLLTSYSLFSISSSTQLNRFRRIYGVRSKRFVIFPSQSAILITGVISKAISKSPAGTFLLYEIDDYYSLPNKDILKAKAKISRKDDSKEPNNIGHKDYQPKINSIKDKVWTSKPTYKDVSLYRPVITNEWREQIKPYTNKIWKPKSNNIRFRPTQNTIPIYDEQFDNRSHRERREIFAGIEKAASKFGYSVRACILRTICEVKHFLLPPGKSMIQDIIRTIFEIPTKSHWNDDYSNASRVNETDCKHLYKNKCPISVLEFALHSPMDISKL